jgi:L-threonylcarbamoyladenylate synthase
VSQSCFLAERYRPFEADDFSRQDLLILADGSFLCGRVRLFIMRTQLKKADASSLKQAAALIRLGQPVGFPTETVYGLGANALDKHAVKRIFAAKGRPADNPLIVHVTSLADVKRLVVEVSPLARKLMKRYWPGPLTLVMRKKNIVPDVVTAGLDTVAVRMPSHPVARKLIKAAGVPIAAPSANRSGRPSPTTAAHVLADLDGRIPLIIDGGPCEVGIESTVLDVTSRVPVLLRPGGITLPQLRKTVGRVSVHRGVLRKVKGRQAARSPGLKHRHYAPNARMVIVTRARLDSFVRRLCKGVGNLGKKRVGVIVFGGAAPFAETVIVKDVSRNPEDAGRGLFAALRFFDEQHVDVIVAQDCPRSDDWLGVRNRLLRAAGFTKA